MKAGILKLRIYLQFVVSRLFGTGVDTFVLWICDHFIFSSYFGKYILSPTISFEFAVLSNFMCSYFWIWKSRVGHRSTRDFFLRFLVFNLSSGAGFLIKMVFLLIFQKIFEWNVVYCNLAALLIYLAGAWLIRRIRKMLRAVFTRRKVEPSLSSFTVSFVNISLTVLLFVVVVTILGVPASTFAALLAAGGLAVGMALSGTLQNFAGGVMILLFKPFKVGDYIEAGGYSGTVDAINITSTQIHTPDNKVVFLRQPG